MDDGEADGWILTHDAFCLPLPMSGSLFFVSVLIRVAFKHKEILLVDLPIMWGVL